MKTILLLSILFFVVPFNNISFSQEEVPIDRKLNRLNNLENGIYKLPFDKNHIRTVIVPEIEEQRNILAPNYPDVLHKYNEEKNNLLKNWIENYPSEYEVYVDYLQTYLRSHK